jgi:hypothetical protein
MWDTVRADLAFQKLCEKTTAFKIENITVGPERRQNSLPKSWTGKAGQELDSRYGLRGKTVYE